MAEKKTGRKLVPARNKKKKWTPEEEAYLSDSWGTKSIKTLAKNLGRSENAVIVPDWVKVKRENDKKQSWQQVPHNTPWTEYDDQKLRRMLKANRYTYTDLSRELRRSEGAVKRRITDLQIKEKPVRKKNKAWTEEEVELLLDMIDQGFTYPQIAEKLERSAMAVRGKYERLQNPNYMRRYNRGRSKDYDYVGIRDVSPAQIRKDMAARKNNCFIEVDELPREEMMI